MRKKYDNHLDNMVQKLNTKIEKKINGALNRSFDRESRSQEKMRDGWLRLGALPMENTIEDDYFRFGSTSGGMGVGP